MEDLDYIIRPAQLSDVQQINQIHNHWVQNSPYIFSDAPITLVETTSLLTKIQQRGSVFNVAWNALKPSEVYGFQALIPGTYRGAIFGSHTCPLTFVWADKRRMRIGEVLSLSTFIDYKSVPWFLGQIGESNYDNEAVTQRVNKFNDDTFGSQAVPIRNIAYKFGKFSSMRVELWSLATVENINKISSQFGIPRL